MRDRPAHVTVQQHVARLYRGELDTFDVEHFSVANRGMHAAACRAEPDAAPRRQQPFDDVEECGRINLRHSSLRSSYPLRAPTRLRARRQRPPGCPVTCRELEWA